MTLSPKLATVKRHLPWTLVLSLLLHVTLTAGLTSSRRGSRTGPGEGGASGAGGPTHEISLEDDGQPASAVPTPPVPPTDEEEAPPAAPDPPAPVASTPPKAKTPPPLPSPTEPAAEPLPEPAKQEPTAAGADGAKGRPPPQVAPEGNENHGRASSGRAAGDVNSLSAQRGRLPGAAECDDPAAGTWVSTKYLPNRQQWYVFTLSVRRSGRALTGRIQSRFWNGSPWEPAPPVCIGDRSDPLNAVVTMQGSGSVEGLQMTFGGTSIASMTKLCPSAPFVPSYALDTFTGTLDTERGEFRSIGNDGGRMRDLPLLFRRVACSD